MLKKVLGVITLCVVRFSERLKRFYEDRIEVEGDESPVRSVTAKTEEKVKKINNIVRKD